METIKLSLDREMFWQKPAGKDVPKINNRIAGCVHAVSPTEKGMRDLAEKIGIDGHTFCPATFKDGIRNQAHFEQQQFIALDFDSKTPDTTITLEDARARAERYGLRPVFAYDTLTSTNHNKFRMVFLNDTSICHRKVAEAVQLALGRYLFPESDPLCYRDISKMYFGGKELRYFDRTIPTIDVETVFRRMTQHLKETDPKHYKERLVTFSRKTDIALNKHGFLDVMMVYDSTELPGAVNNVQNGGNSPNSIIYSPNIKANGENPPKWYKIGVNESTSKTSVVTSVTNTDVTVKEKKNHKKYRSQDLKKIHQKCQLFREFEAGKRDMTHDELLGLATNLLQVETGIKRFKEIQLKYPEFYDTERMKEWERHLSYIDQEEYKPQCCSGFCPYCEKCEHGTNILSSSCPKGVLMERIPGYSEEFCSIEELQDDTYETISKAFYARDDKVHVIRSQTGACKSYSYLRLMSENPEMRFIIATPTNLLKDETEDKAIRMNIDAKKTPSLEQIKGDIPPRVWKHIQKLYKGGQHGMVHIYIQQVLEKEKVPCLEKYMKEREALKDYKGNVITTHRYLLTMDENRLKEFDTIIIDEDIIFKSVIPNQGEITVSELKKMMDKSADSCLLKKIKEILKQAKEQSCVKADSFEWDKEDDEIIPFDLPSFCLAEKFYIRRKSKEKNLKEDSVSFLKPVFFKDVKYIMVSATANEAICRLYFGENRVKFYECKKAKYMGRLNQYPGKSMSRSSIASSPGIIRRLINRFGFSEERVITFMKENIGNLHFGNTEGSNTLEGKNILVIGTPYHADFLYKLAAFTMGIDFDEDEEMEMQVIEYNGYRFRFKTFKNADLRAIHLWMIESELEQAVGRARLLRNSCEVHLFSSFPISQSHMVVDFDYNKE